MAKVSEAPIKRVEFTPEMKDTHTILVPNMLPTHFKLIVKVIQSYGYSCKLLTSSGRGVVDAGLKYVHNDTCYPALLTIGQMMDALHSGEYDLDKVALIMSQTGGGCRASNYIHLIRKALEKDGLSHIPVISINLSGLESNSGFKITLPMLRKAIAALAYGDILMLLKNQTKPYEVNAGESDALMEEWTDKLVDLMDKGKAFSQKDCLKYFDKIASSFAKIELKKTDKVKVGVVGEIYVKYSSLANNDLEEFLMEQGCEVMVPGILGFMIFKVDNRLEDIALYGGGTAKKAVMQILFNFFEKYENGIIDVLKNYPQFVAPSPYAHLKELVGPIIGYGCKMGEGWLLTAEMMELIESGYGNIVCTQPFGCLPNHIVGKGMIRKIKDVMPDANIVPIDYDPSATKVNQENRIKLMLAVAKEQQEEAMQEALKKNEK